MSAKKIIEQLPNAGRENRLQAANYFLNHPEEVNELLQLTFRPSYTWHYKAATKVQAMQIVFDLGQLPASEKWVLPELKAILSENIVSQSAGYRNRAEKILKRLKNI